MLAACEKAPSRGHGTPADADGSAAVVDGHGEAWSGDLPAREAWMAHEGGAPDTGSDAHNDATSGGQDKGPAPVSDSSTPTKNLVVNPGFENDFKSWGKLGNAASYQISTATSAKGSKSAKIELNPSGGDNQYVYQRIFGNWGGKKFRYSGWIRTQSVTSNFVLTIKFYHVDHKVDKNGSDVYFLKWTKGTTPWKFYEKTFTAPPKCKEIIVYLIGKKGSGAGFCDAFSLTLLP
jgi:hypothetical protein